MECKSVLLHSAHYFCWWLKSPFFFLKGEGAEQVNLLRPQLPKEEEGEINGRPELAV
jgi:hypothetical protein